MNIVIPLAGKDPRFDIFGTPKPLIDIKGKPLIKWCTDSLDWPFSEKHNLIFIILKEQEEQFHLGQSLRELYGNSINLVFVEEITAGAACTVLLAENLINNNEELIIYLADIYFDADLKKVIKNKDNDVKGFIPVFKSNNKKYSYALLNEDDNIRRVAEKVVISTNASSGFYYFTYGRDFVWAAKEMIRKNLRVNNWFYICPVYQQLIERGDKIKIIESEFKWGLGSPDEISKFINEIN